MDSLSINPGSTILLGELAGCNIYDVNYVADTKAACSEEPDNSCADFSGHESVNTEFSEKNSENERCCLFYKRIPPKNMLRKSLL